MRVLTGRSGEAQRQRSCGDRSRRLRERASKGEEKPGGGTPRGARQAGNRSSPAAYGRKHKRCPHLSVSPGNALWTSELQNLKMIDLCLLKAASFEELLFVHPVLSTVPAALGTEAVKRRLEEEKQRG